MENFKSILLMLIILGVLTLTGYWAFSTMESGSTHVSNQNQKELKDINNKLEEENIELKKSIELLEFENAQKNEISKIDTSIDIPNPETLKSESSVYKYQSLIDDIQKLVKANIYMKKGSRGTRVGILQKFLNLYNNTSNKIDNDYGAGTTSLIKKFQTSQKITVDGETGPKTYIKMISWLESK